MIQRDVPGFAIGGLSGGEEKDDFWRMVTLSTDHLPREKPRYLMGVGYVCLYSDNISHENCLDYGLKNWDKSVNYPFVLQICCGFGGMCSSGVWYVWLRVSHTHCSKLSSPHTLIITFKLATYFNYFFDSHVPFSSEVWLCLGALGICPSKT